MIPTTLPRWRSSSFRLALFFAVLFFFCILAMLGITYWQSSEYMEKRVDRIIQTIGEKLIHTPSVELPASIDDAINHDLRKINFYGLFDKDLHFIAGNLRAIPSSLTIDGKIRDFIDYKPILQMPPASAYPRARVMATSLSNGNVLVLGRDIGELIEIRSILLHGLLVGGGLTLLLGLMLGALFSFKPVRRIEEIRKITSAIMLGNLSQRIPITENEDEIDMLAMTVNSMLDEIERLMGDIKGVTDSIAHDLRTPLSHLRFSLSRAQQQTIPDSPSYLLFDDLLNEVDSLLIRFRALLRISEIDNSVRRSGFSLIYPANIVANLMDLYEPLAEENGLFMSAEIAHVSHIYADPDLLSEALNNLVENAIKFTNSGGRIRVILSQFQNQVWLDIIDSGPGIDPREREFVMRPFKRGKDSGYASGLAVAGHGLGLSIVSAILRLHGFTLDFLDCDNGTHLRIRADVREAL